MFIEEKRYNLGIVERLLTVGYVILDLLFKVTWTAFYITPFVIFWLVALFLSMGLDIVVLKSLSTAQFFHLLKISIIISLILSIIKNYLFLDIDRYRKITINIRRYLPGKHDDF